ncbi:unnamed protein product [Allacma fusca]|uniref:Uncharacterized protein n=1 Tax=Allacma fusca TaxID=39272 RepID=A0A8J2P470_9HEXA|nr:unnamed protein product [Allacma fusca]
MEDSSQRIIICCCGAGGWTKVIGWFQTVVNFSSAVILFIFLTGLSVASSAANQSPHPDKIEQMRLYQLATTALFVYLMMALIGVVMGVLLLKGSYGRKPAYLQAWIFFAVMHLVISFMVSLAEGFAGTYTEFLKYIYVFIMSLLIQGFCIGVVGIHMKEIQFDQERGFSRYHKTYAI